MSRPRAPKPTRAKLTVVKNEDQDDPDAAAGRDPLPAPFAVSSAARSVGEELVNAYHPHL